MTYLEAKKEIEKGLVGRLYLLYGMQTYLMEDLLQSIVKQSLGSIDDPNIITYSLADTIIDIAVEEAETYPFFGEKKVVIINDFTFVTSQKQDGKMEHDLARLEKYIEEPSQEAVLILLSPYEKLDERKKITKLLKKKAIVVECATFNDRTTKRWLEEQALKRNFSFTDSGIERLLARVGPQLLMLVSEMDKLALYVGEGGTVDANVVDLLVVRSLEENVFALIDFSVRQRLDEALVIYHDLLKQREEPLKILALIARQIRIFYQVKELSRRSYSQSQIATQLKLHPYPVKLAGEQVKRFDDEQLFYLLEETANTDYAIKSGKMDQVLAVELLLIKVASTLRKKTS